jgi:leucyl-tRNA synthetase
MFADSKLLNHWLPVDLYIGGAEHAVLHLLYARFWHRFLYDIGKLNVKEPFKKLFHQGMILGDNGEKMSKSRGNVVSSDYVIEEFGADTLRLYEMFMGPLEASLPWSTTGLEGAHRFLNRVWRLYDGVTIEDKISDKNSGELDYVYNFTVKKVTEDFENLQFNTAISQMMIFVNEVYKAKSVYRPYLDGFIRLFSPLCPHIGEEIYERLGHKDGISLAPWPTYEPKHLVLDEIEIAVQVNGKLRATIKVANDASKEEVEKLALAEERVKRHLEGLTIRKIIVVLGKIVNIVAN